MSDAELNARLQKKINNRTKRNIELGAFEADRADTEFEHRADTETLLKESSSTLLDNLVMRARKQRRNKKLGEAVLCRHKAKLTLNRDDRSRDTLALSPLIYPVRQPEGAYMVSYGWQFGTRIEDEATLRLIEHSFPNGTKRQLSIYRTAQNDNNPDQSVTEKWYDIYPWARTGFVVRSYPPANDRQHEAMLAAQAANSTTYKPESSIKVIDGNVYITGPLNRRNAFSKPDPMEYVPTAGQDAIAQCYELTQEALRTLRF